MNISKDEKTVAIYDPRRPLAQGESPARTLLPGPVANLITYGTSGASLFIKGGTKIATWAIAGSRETTLTSIELARAAVEIILTRAGKDVSDRRASELGRAEAANILEKSVRTSIATTSFAASTLFYAGTAGLNAISGLSISSLSTLNAIFGCTETSRAVATIITLVRTEFVTGEVAINYFDLFVGVIGFVLLQRWGRRKTDREFREGSGEEIIWDTIIDDRGFRADVVGTEKTEYFDSGDQKERPNLGRSRSFISPEGDEQIEAIPKPYPPTPGGLNISLSPQDQARLTDEEIKQHIIDQLPHGVHATITSETITAKTIRVDIFNTQTTDISAPPGTVLISEDVHRPRNQLLGDDGQANEGLHQQTIVFQASLRRSNSADMKPTEKLRMTPSNSIDVEDVEDADEALVMLESPKRTPSPTDSVRLNGADSTSTFRPQSQLSLGPSIIQSSSVTTANQKKPRRPAPSPSGAGKSREKQKVKRALGVSAGWAKVTQADWPGKEGPLKKVMKSLSPNASSTSDKEQSNGSNSLIESKKEHEETKHMLDDTQRAKTPDLPRLKIGPERQLALNKSLPPAPQSCNSPETSKLPPKSGYYTVRESRRNSVVSQVDTYSTHSVESRPVSPTLSKSTVQTTAGLSKATSERNIAAWGAADDRPESSDNKNHRRSRSFIPSLYSVATTGSEGSLILAPRTPMPLRSIFDDHETILALIRDGKTPGIFPNAHLVSSIRRYHRFSAASYGSSFLRFMGMMAPDIARNAIKDIQRTQNHHDEHHTFSQHTGLPPETVIFSSFADPVGGPITSDPGGAHPLVHFVSIDHDFKAVVLTCRGTLGIQDVLTDMICDYDSLLWRGTTYKVHRGILASARRLLSGPGSRVFSTLKHAMEEYPDYGLVMTGHSLGGAVAAVLGILISEPSSLEKSGALFATATPQRLLNSTSATSNGQMIPPVFLPSNRPLHVYTYGSPACLSPALRLATRGLITSTINSTDIVPSLSLGILQDMRSVSLALKNDTSDAVRQVASRVWGYAVNALNNKFYTRDPPPLEETGGLDGSGGGVGGDPWAWAALKTLRAGMNGTKLVPPGEVFIVESTRVLDRQRNRSIKKGGAAGIGDDEIQPMSLGRPATRIQLKYIRDVETRFGEVRFGSGMFADHSPTRYESNLAALAMGVVEEGGAV
ncbi:MAG: hypothetical protein Q9160_001049 [Pyrenula sp. 1 TL-2023]